jgi:transposase-like protein
MTPFLGAWERLVLMRDGYYSTDKRRSRRAAMLLALDQGTSAATVARMSGCSRTTVYYWLHLYKQYRNVAVFSPATIGEVRGKLASGK